MSGRNLRRQPLRNPGFWADFLIEHAQVLSIALFFVLCCLLFAVFSPVFLMPGNLLNLLRQDAPMLIVAVAMTFVITTGGIDLSVGSIVALTNALAAIALRAGLPWPLMALAILLVGALIGAAQGWFISYQKIPAFIVTLAGLSMLRGLALLLTKGYSIPLPPHGVFLELGRGWLLGLPVPAILACLVAASGLVLLARTRYGRQVVAVGANAEAARRAGMPAQRVIASVYVLSGVASALAGLVIAARLGSGSSNAAEGFELNAIAAVVLGGTALLGGVGTVIGTVLGALTIAVIGNGLILLHVSPFLTQIVTGAIILLAIWLNARVFARLTVTRRKA
ncbi:ABC transporter permease [Lichenicoccus sp.]|uniref:ABC transporter permease n=1 Tax=Lichenicoccus sp. TaxID=2781899 RepID=UPI003D09AEEF